MTTINDTNRPKRNLSAPPDPRARNGGPVDIADAAAEPPEDRVFTMPEATLPDPPVARPAPAPKPLPTFTIHCLLDDFPIDVAFQGRADQLAGTIAHLRSLGAVPPTPAARAAVAEERERSAPTCQDDTCDCYGKALRESTKQPGSFFCPGKIGTKSGKPIYCKSKG